MWGGKGLRFILHFQFTVPHGEKSGQELKQGRSLKCRNQKNAAYWLAPKLTFSSFFYTAQTHLPRDGAAHSERAFLNRLATKKVPAHPYMPTGQPDEGDSSTVVPSSQMCQVDNCDVSHICILSNSSYCGFKDQAIVRKPNSHTNPYWIH